MGIKRAAEESRQRYRLNYWKRDQENWFNEKEARKKNPVLDRTDEFQLEEDI